MNLISKEIKQLSQVIKNSNHTKVSSWMREPGPDPYCWMRIIVGGNPKSLEDRVAFCEKSPRIRVAPFTTHSEESDKWKFGPKGGYDDAENLEWCDIELKKLGYVITDTTIPDECS